MLRGGDGINGGVLWLLLLLASGIGALIMFVMSFIEENDEDTD